MVSKSAISWLVQQQCLEQNLQAHSHPPAAAEGTDEAIAIRWLKSHFWQYLLSVLPTHSHLELQSSAVVGLVMN